MSIVEVAVKRILNEIPKEVIIESSELNDKSIAFDTHGGYFEEMERIIEKILAAEIDVLGRYEHMQSPGKIVLMIDKLAPFFWGLASQINRNGYYMEQVDLPKMAHMVVLKTYTHEQFHHFADVARYMYGGVHDHYLEEALAVAWSRKKLEEQRSSWSSKEARLSSPIYSNLLIHMYKYTSNGYRDWVLYQSEPEFLTAVAEYLGGPNKDFLEKSGICVGEVLLKVLEEVKNKGVVELCI